MNRTMIALLGALMLAGCGGDEEATDDAAADHAETPAVEAPAAPAPPAGPPPVEGYDWSMHGPSAEEPDLVSLTYAVPGTGDTPLYLDCRRGSGVVAAHTDSGTPGVDAVILRSGEAQAMYLVTSRIPSELSGGELLTIELPAMDAPLQAFRTAGWINLSVAGQARDLAAHPGPAREAIESFFRACAPAPASGAAPG